MLHITGKHLSGFHHLQSLVMFKGEGDLIKVTPHEAFSLKIEGPFKNSLAVENNLVLKAAKWIGDRYLSKDKGHITLIKNLPVSSGIGGGSSDAAATIAALLEMWNIECNENEKKELIKQSGELGADVPVCLAHHLLNKSYFWINGTGKEEMPEPLEVEDPLKNYSLLLVNPTIPLSTPEVFKVYNSGYDNSIPPPKDALSFMDFLQETKNSLTEPAIRIVPEVETILNILSTSKDCLLARMSGSGATCFGVYKNEQAREEVIEKMNQNWWVYKL